VGRKPGKFGCDLVTTDEDWDKLLALRRRTREALEAAGSEEDELSLKQAALLVELAESQKKLADLQRTQSDVKQKRRRLEARYVKLAVDQEEMSAREWASIAELEVLEEEEARKQSSSGSLLRASEDAPLSSPPAPVLEDPLVYLDLPAECFDGRAFSLDELGDGTVGFVSSPS